jgi:hypothetical protein
VVYGLGDLMKKIITYSVIFSILAIILTKLFIPLFIGNPNLGSTPVVLAAVLCPWPVGIIVGIIKGIGASLWTGKWYVEFPAGVGDALMAAFTYRLSKKIKAEYAVVTGQISRYIFTSGMVALFIALMITSRWATPTINTLFSVLSQRLSNSLPALSFLTNNPGFLASFAIAWIDTSFPAVTLSIIANAIVAFVIIKILGKRLSSLIGK